MRNSQPLHSLRLLTLVTGLALAVPVVADEPLYQPDAESIQGGELPGDFLVMDGNFEVTGFEGRQVIALPGAPLGSFGVLFGPTEEAGVAITARINSTRKGRRYPSFSVGLNGVSGFKLRVSPMKRAVELVRGDESLASVDYDWESGWTRFRLEVVKEGEQWRARGKVWKDGDDEPADWTITYLESNEVYAGQPSFWGQPFSGEPIYFDDIRLWKLADR